MSGAESRVMAYVLNSLWQVPLIAAAAWMAARVARPLGPGVEHRVWVAALLGEAVIPAASLLPWERADVMWPWHLYAQHAGQGSVVVQVGSGVASDGWRFPAAVIGVFVGLYAAVTLYFCARFVRRWMQLKELERSAEPLVLTDSAEMAWRLAVSRSGAKEVVLVISRRVFAPLTMGLKRSCVMLPQPICEH